MAAICEATGADVDEVAALAVDDLQRDTAGLRSDDRDAGVQCLGDLDLEAFASRKLKSDLGIRHESVEN